ncbi:MAG: SDR family NAD(P)-dependent oxidoreductase [Myxococcota bacterium]
MRPWMWPWAPLYLAQVTIAMFVWPLLYAPGGFLASLFGALVSGGVFALITRALWNARDRFQPTVRETLAERYGEWALVTGASAGIGAEFARALARGGISCVLSARREDRLTQLAQELEARHGVKTRVVAVDLAKEDGGDRLADAVADLEIGVLVNNAGFGYAGRFDKLDPARLRDMVNLNCLAPLVLTRRLLPAMRERDQGAVVFTGSIAGCQPLPLHGVYAATKAFDNLLGEALWGELEGTGVQALSLLPGSTETEFQQVAGEISHEGESPQDVVETALQALGRQPSVISGWLNWIRANAATRLLPRSVLTLVAKDVIEKQTPEELR